MNVDKIVQAFHATIQAKKDSDKVLKQGINWQDRESQKPYYEKVDAYRKAEKAMRGAYRDMVKAWCAERGVVVNVRSEARLSSYPVLHIEWGDTSVWNDKDTVRGIGGKKISNWTNKVTVTPSGKVRTHKIRTDEKMLGKFADDLAAFIKEVIETTNQELKDG